MDGVVAKYNKRPIVADIYTLGNMKVLLDDVLNEYLASCGRRRNYAFPDAKNAVGLVSIALATAVTYMSLNYAFDRVARRISVCVALYFAINTLVFAVGLFEENKYRYDGFYLVTRVNSAPSYTVEHHLSTDTVSGKYTRSFYDLFDTTGRMDHNAFLGDMEAFFNKGC